MDQTAAFAWGYKFAPAFGGDTSQVTLNGCSAGSESVFWHMTIEESWPYFHRVSTVGVGLNAVIFKFILRQFISTIWPSKLKTNLHTCIEGIFYVFQKYPYFPFKKINAGRGGTIG